MSHPKKLVPIAFTINIQFFTDSEIHVVTTLLNTKELMHCHYGTNNRAPRWTLMDPCKPEARPGAREESASPAWLATPAMNVPNKTKVYIWRLDTGCGQTLYRKCHSHNTRGKRHNNTGVEPLAGNCTTSSTRQREQVWQKSKIQKNWCTVTVAPTKEHHGGHSRTPANQRWDQVPGRMYINYNKFGEATSHKSQT